MTERKFTPADAEVLDVLDGSRRKGAIDKAAVRIEDLAGILSATNRTIADAAAAPTQAEFNALASAVRDLQNRLFLVAEALNRRRRPRP